MTTFAQRAAALRGVFYDDVIDHAAKAPTVIAPETMLVMALAVMGERQIWDLPVLEDQMVRAG